MDVGSLRAALAEIAELRRDGLITVEEVRSKLCTRPRLMPTENACLTVASPDAANRALRISAVCA